tara:strand:- start:202 stop:552 length:351 start_codon:yes stop_codon:yes gene_type:complete
MPKKISNKFLIKAYYNLLLIREVKENTFMDFMNPMHNLTEYASLAEQDLEELEECIAAFKELVDDAADEAYFSNTSLVSLLEEDPYYKIVRAVHAAEDELEQATKTRTKIDKKLMN